MFASSCQQGSGEKKFGSTRIQSYDHPHTKSGLCDKQNFVSTRAVQWKTGKVVLKIACTTDIVCRVCKGADLELPIDGVGTPAARIGTWETVRQDDGALATVH